MVFHTLSTRMLSLLASSDSVIADLYSVSLKSLYELLALVLRSAVGVEYGGDTILCNGFMESLQTEFRLHLCAEPPGKDHPAPPIKDCSNIHHSRRQLYIGYVGSPHLVDVIDLLVPHQIREFPIPCPCRL